ncbi:SRPBCC family protein [Qipengyuania nanhaisediminis]|uniref:Polyketide cyclase / dehydrase and lipid transport n=1 Tax=Qipengyuania nanhaisediminis TaxID=604088 RepID=A0A1I5MB49_9SPHN|nr:SRPBCC family protein [Qipengyuania nanhaisediminis]SFP06231.1 Polyketide cyclase / dehydrase and lipid transport [Qipengyuania nanhaisediminis]
MLRFHATLAAIGLATLAVPASAEIVATSESGFVTKASARVAATPREAWLALIKPSDWWNDAHTWSADAANMTLVPSAGGCFCEKIPGEGDIPLDGSAQHAIVVQAVPDRALRLRGGLGPLQAVPATGVLTVTLSEIDGGTRIDWEYNVGGPMGFEIGQISKAVDGVMNQQLLGLRDHLGALDGDEAEAAGETPDQEDEDQPAEEASVGDQVDALAD